MVQTNLARNPLDVKRFEDHPTIRADPNSHVVVWTPDGPTTMEEDVHICRLMEAWLERRTHPYAMVADLRRMTLSGAKARQVYADFLNRTKIPVQRWCAGVAMVVSGPVVQGVLTAVFWLAPPVYRHAIVRSVGEGHAWVNDRLLDFQPHRPGQPPLS